MKKNKMWILTTLLLFLIAISICYAARVWVCSNHNPAHTATSTSQMRNLTNSEGCTGWRLI